MSRCYGKNCPASVVAGTPSQLPDPKRFTLIKVLEAAPGMVVVEARYEGCTNYGGRKLMLYEGMTETRILRMMSLDPHFSEDGKGPIARFEPTDRGFRMALAMARR